MSKCPCENCICFAMCLSKSIGRLTACKLFTQYVNVENIYEKHSRLYRLKLLFDKHQDGLIKVIDSLIRDLEEFMSYKRRRNLY